MKKSHKNTNKRKRKLRRKLSKKRFTARQTKPKAGNVLKYFQRYDPRKHSHYVFVIICRVSSIAQVKAGNLYTQHYRMEKFVSENKLTTLEGRFYVVRSVLWSGKPRELAEQRFQKNPKYYPNPKYYKPHYPFLKRLVSIYWETMMETGLKNVAFLFESVNRAIRSDDYDCTNNKDADLTEGELEMFQEIMTPFPGAKPFPVITICHPMASPAKVDKWRKTYKGDFVRPDIPEFEMYFRKRIYSEVIRLRFVENKSYGEITKITGIAKSTVADWCDRVSFLLKEYEK